LKHKKNAHNYRWLWLVLLLASTGMGFCQTTSRRDSLYNKFRTDSLKNYRYKKFRPHLAIDNRNSVITKAPINLRGIQVGLRIAEKHVAGVGFYRTTPFSQKAYTILNPDNRLVNRRIKMDYATLYYKYKLMSSRFVDAYLAFELGAGEARARLFDSINNVLLKAEIIKIFPLGAGMQMVLKPVKWFGVTTMGGYRYVNEGSIRFNFNGWYYSFGLWLDVRQVYRDIRFHGRIKKRYLRDLKTLT